MDILILTFSPAGSTLKIAQLLAERLAGNGNGIQLIDLTRNADVFKHGRIEAFLAGTVKRHDLICIGSPVYEKHIEFSVKAVYEALPAPDGIVWGDLAVPFFTYGGISTGIALRQAEEILRTGGRKVIAAMKIEAAHIVTRRLKTRVNVGLPGDEARPYVDELAQRITGYKPGDALLTRADVNYQGRREKIFAAIMKERLLHRYKYGRLAVEQGKCTGCFTCVATCPIQRIEKQGAQAAMTGTLPECIHCFSCVNACPQEAITYENGDAGWAEIDRIFGKVAREGSPFRSNETPGSAVYPLR